MCDEYNTTTTDKKKFCNGSETGNLLITNLK